MMSLAGFQLSAQLAKLQQQDLYRSRKVLTSPQGVHIEIDGKKLRNFSSNDYLGLANHPKIIQAFQTAANQYGVGSGAAHLICGHSFEHHALEAELAEFTGRERALLFSTGYMANLGVICALLNKYDWVFADKLNHASLIDGALLSNATLRRYLHNNVTQLASKINGFQETYGDNYQALVVSDGVFSMDGDLAALPELVKLTQEPNIALMIDDAHGFGVLGDKGGGIVEYFNCNQADVPILIGTLGKAFGTAGAFVAGSQDLIEILIQKASTYIYTTAMPAAIAAATRASLHCVIQDNWRREHLKNLIQQFREGATQMGLSLMESITPIQPLFIGDNRVALECSQQLYELGFLVPAIRSPTVPMGTARLRITLSANHQTEDIEKLLVALNRSQARIR